MRKNIVRTGGAVAAIAAISLGAIACGDVNTGSGTTDTETVTTSSTSTVATTSTTGTTGTAGTTATTGSTSTSPGSSAATSSATVTLGKPQEMAITAPSTIKAGTVTFNVTNGGSAPHEFVLLRTQTKAADLPTEGGKAKETGLVDRTDELAAGASATVKVAMTPGHYVVLCNLPGHYQAGMRKDITVQ